MIISHLDIELDLDLHPVDAEQARAALDALRSGALVHEADPGRIGVIGSSAGGLLAGLLATGAPRQAQPLD